MSDSVYLGLQARQLEDSPAYQPISCVKLTIGGEDANGNPIVCQAGNPNSGRTIETSNPLIWDAEIGNRVAQNIYDIVKGYAYKPYTAEGALINPVAEIGDAVEVGDVYSVIADVETSFTPLMSANISAPVGSDIDHEYPYESSENRELMQQLQGLKTSFIVENGKISAEISDVRQTEQGLQNNITQLEMTVNGIHAYTDQEIKTISGGVVHDWAEINFTPSSISSKVSSYFDAKGAADTALTNSKSYTDGKIAPIAGQYTSAIEQSAKQIMATVAAAETIWDTSTLSQTIQNNIATYGYGTPPNSTASQYSGKYYLDQSSGTLYLSNGSKWTKQSTQLKTIQTTTNSAITQQANRITSVINSVTALGNRVTEIAQTDSDISLSVYSDTYGTTYFKLSDGSGKISSTSFNFETDIVNVAGNLTAKSIAAYVSIESPYINGGSISGTDILASRFMSYSRTGYLSLASDSYYDGTLYFGPTNYYQSRYNCYMCVSSRGSYTTLDLGGASMIMTQNGSARFTPGGVWDFSNCSQVKMPGGTTFP